MRLVTRWFLFYPLVAALAGGLVWLSLRDGVDRIRDPVAQTGRVEGDTLVLDAGHLTEPEAAGPGRHVFVAEAAGAPIGLRIATANGLAAPGSTERGVRILLAPAAAARFAGRATIVEIDAHAIGETTAQQLAVSLQDAAPAHWELARLGDLPAVLRFELPATAAAPQAIGFFPVSEASPSGFDRGVEIRAIRVRPRP